jgi:colanic acid biosynthesis glycosyl transferase WcaI
MKEQRLLVISELYYPEQNATGYFLTGIAEGIAASGREVAVLCAQPTYNQRGIKALVTETRHGVAIRRIRSLACNPRRFVGKAANALSITAGFFVAGLRTIQRGDVVLIVTNPPLAPFLLRWATRLKGARFCLLVHDIYPDVLVPLKMLQPTGLPYRLLEWANSRLYQSCDHIIVLGRDMKRLVRSKLHRPDPPPITIIPNWGEVEAITPRPRQESRLARSLGFDGASLVALYSGNHGKTHNLLEWVDVACEPGAQTIQFLFIGDGTGKRPLVKLAANRQANNMTFLDFVDRAELNDSLNAGDIGLISFIPGMEGISVPSRLYNLFAAGKPVLAVCGADSELASVIREEDAGWVVEPGHPEVLAKMLIQIANSPAERARMGANARRAAETKYARDAVIESYRKVLSLIDHE